MKELLIQIQKGLDTNLYFLALFTALAIPDICGALSSENGETDGQKYKAWFDQYIAPKYINFTDGADCYRFRCSLLHQGRSQLKDSKFSRIWFIEPGTTSVVMHDNTSNDTLNIDVGVFCKDIIAGAEEYLSKNEQTDLYKTNYDKFVRRYPNGIPPLITGVPVIG
ncbi:hypothetical protein IIA95_00510 [Patescibacteria group bacterium]|nr:hypothetical protein [Patescibacteria group bacterium]